MFDEISPIKFRVHSKFLSVAPGKFRASRESESSDKPAPCLIHFHALFSNTVADRHPLEV